MTWMNRKSVFVALHIITAFPFRVCEPQPSSFHGLSLIFFRMSIAVIGVVLSSHPGSMELTTLVFSDSGDMVSSPDVRLVE